MVSRRTNLHRSVNPTRHHIGGGVVCIRQDMKRRSGSLGRRFSCRCIGAGGRPLLGVKPTKFTMRRTAACSQKRKFGEFARSSAYGP